MSKSGLRVAFSGASGTGKTTLATWLSDALELPLNPVGARSVAEEMGFVDEHGVPFPYMVDQADLAIYTAMGGDSPDASQGVRRAAAKAALREGVSRKGSFSCRTLFQKRLLSSKIAWEKQHEATGFITDRTTCDQLAYAILHDAENLSAEVFETALTEMMRYDFVFLTPTDVFNNFSEDPARKQSEAYHMAYECLLEGLTERSYINEFTELRDYNARVWYLTSPDPFDRKSYIMKVLFRENQEDDQWTNSN